MGLALSETLTGDSTNLLAAHKNEWRTYLLEHIKPTTPDGRAWTVAVDDLGIGDATQTASGPYRELSVHLTLMPPAGASSRAFTLNYDAVMHQVVTHSALVSVRQDWAAGVTPEGTPAEVGVVRVNPVDGTIAPLVVNREGGSLWTGFVGMLKLGISHIAAGTDHLLFLLTLLLPAPLLAGLSRWGGFAGTRRSLLNILKIITAFTVGHSLTLILGTVAHLHIPDQPIEVLIALSILVSAIHALRPIFPGREVLVAGFFGLIHGMAFSLTLAELNLNAGQMALSLLGFNLGIEAMQLTVMGLTLPWLILLARTKAYPAVRVGGASVAALASLGWLGQRLGLDNPLGTLADDLGVYGPWVIVGLAVLALVLTGLKWLSRRTPPRLDHPPIS